MNYHVVLSQVGSRYASFLLVYIPYLFGFHMGDAYPLKWRNYFATALAVGIFCLALWGGYGSHIENGDPIYGGGDEVQDFEPTQTQRNEYGLEALIAFEIAALFGVAKRNQKKVQQFD